MVQLNQKIWMIVVVVGGLIGSGTDVISRDRIVPEEMSISLSQSDMEKSEEEAVSVSPSNDNYHYPEPYVLFGENEELWNMPFSFSAFNLDKTINLTGWLMREGISYGVRIKDAVPHFYLLPGYLMAEGKYYAIEFSGYVLGPVLMQISPTFDDLRGF